MTITHLASGFVLCSMLAAVPAAALEILSPAPQTVVKAGAVVSITIGPSAGEVLQSASVATFDETAAGAAGPQAGTFTAQIHVPADAVGPTFIFAMGDLAAGGVTAAHVQLVADPGPLTQLTVNALPVLTAIGQVVPITVQGVFADGITRGLPLADQGTTYATTNDAVLGVDASGVMQARTRGTAQIIVTNTHVVSGVTATAGVTVRCDVPNPPDNRIPIANAGPDQTVAPQTVVQLDGSASSDPDGDALSFLWTQEAGNTVILRAADTAAPFFLSPAVTSPQVLAFSLAVRDSKGATTFPTIVRVTVQP
jgi:hypothetical protein